MRHGFELLHDSGADMRMIIAVAGRPPACDPSKARARPQAQCANHALRKPQAAAPYPSSAHRAARCGRAKPLSNQYLANQYLASKDTPCCQSRASRLNRNGNEGKPVKSLDAFARSKLAELDTSSLRRGLVKTERSGSAIVMRDGRRLVSFSCNDYLGLSHITSRPRPLPRSRRWRGRRRLALVTGNYLCLTSLRRGLRN